MSAKYTDSSFTGVSFVQPIKAVTDLDGTMRRVFVKVMPQVLGSCRMREKSRCKSMGRSP